MTFAQVRRFALSLPEVTEEPHFDLTSFRVRRKIFATARAGENHVNIFVGEALREPALAIYSEYLEKLLWGGKVVGLRVALPKASATVVKDLLRAAWLAKAPKSLAR